uniref:Protein artichoke-like n=1 Tax=Diabrotica virgifera virgifera TaxID=50390 RepID=A0A6P7FYT5_DIAVI
MPFGLKTQLFVLILSSLLIKEIQTIDKTCPPQEAILPCRCLIKGKEYQIWCSHSNLSTVLESLKSIANYITIPIDELIIENNYLPSLPGRTFSPLKILRLMLRYNTLERVSTDWLADLESSLMELFIVEPKLSSLPQSSLMNLKNLKAVTIRSKLLKRLPIFSGLPVLRYVQVESTSLVEVSASTFKDNPSLEKLHLQFCPKLSRLEANVFDDLPKLDLINITYCGLEWVHPRTFSRLPSLKELSLVGNKISDPGMIGRSSRELPNLEIIKLDYNYIGIVEEATFVDMRSLKRIYLSNNVIAEIRKGAFHILPALKTLDLSKNMIKRIQHQSFYQPSVLEELYLQDNALSNVMQLRSILEDLPRLIYLDVSYNKLDSIPFRSLMGHSTLEQLNLGYNQLQMIDKEAFIGMPALRDLILTNNSIADTRRAPFWNLPALKSVHLSKNYLRRLEPRFLINISALRRADLSQNGLNFIDPEAFLPTPLLEHINMSSNNIKNFHPVTFRHLTQLYELDVSHNNLKSLISGLPRNIEHLILKHNEISGISFSDLNLPSLRLLDLSGNRIQSLGEDQLKNLHHLRKLYLNSNFLRILQERSLEGLIKLETLDLSDNRISEVHPLAMRSTSELKFLNIAHNQLTLIGPSLLSNAKNLRKLYAGHNQLAEILSQSFDENLNLEELDLASNLLVQFPHTIYGLEKLKKLDLSSNRLKNINSTIVSSLTNLREIKLSKNFIQILEGNSFGNLKNLKSIYLDENDIMLVEQNFVKMLPSLKMLKLQKNKLEELAIHTFNTLLSLQNLDLQENILKIIDPNAFNLVPQLLTLNLSHNEISKIEDAGLQNLRSLELLDMSFNKITTMSPSLSQLEWLVELRLKNNFICEVEEGVFTNMPRLKVLDLRSNKLVAFPEVAVERLRENTAKLDVRGNPLECSCDMLWLKSWLRESSQNSPRCSDGTLLKEMPLSLNDCPAEARNEKPFSGCDTELLNAPNFGNMQMYSKYASLRNFSADSSRGKNHLAPNPEESEYFYDEYIDYPFNESAVDPSGYSIIDKMKDKGHTIVERVPITTRKPKNHTTGNTPVLYAAPSKKLKPTIPPKVPDSPSTSGFTFFGIPLPALNLNNIFPKKENNGVAPQQAERKNAIVNNPRMDKRQPTMKGGMMVPQIHLVPHISQNMQNVHQIQRPPPELQGGFMPMLPESGGFQPIPDPRFTYTTTGLPNIQRPIENSSPSELLSEISQDTTTVENESDESEEYPEIDDDIKPLENQLQEKNYNLEQITNRSSLLISADSTSQANNRNKKSQLVDGKINITRLESIANVQVFNKSESHSFIKEYSPTTSSISEHRSSSTVEADEAKIELVKETTPLPEPATPIITPQKVTEKSSQIELIKNVEQTGLPNIPQSVKPFEPTVITSYEDEVKDPELSGMETQIKETEQKFVTTEIPITDNRGFKLEKHNSSGSLLSTLLVPGGNQPLFKPTARSTITKVASPHEGNINDPLMSTIQVSESENGKVKTEKEFNKLEENIITSTEEGSNENWYFENYNKKNLEPFVAKVVNDKNLAVKTVFYSVYILLPCIVVTLL